MSQSEGDDVHDGTARAAAKPKVRAARRVARDRTVRAAPLVVAIADGEAVPAIRRASGAIAALVSIAAHAAIAITGAALVAMHLNEDASPSDDVQAEVAPPLPGPTDTIVIDLPESSGASDVAVASSQIVVPSVEAPALAGGAKVARIDDGSTGRGGDGSVSAAARNLSPRADDDTVAYELRDDVDRDQENRLKTADERASRVDRRQALTPMELTFVASGKGFKLERHPVAASPASVGVASLDTPSVLGGAAGKGSPRVDGEGDLVASLTPGASTAGSDVERPAAGTRYGGITIKSIQISGDDVATARPHVDRGKPSVAADEKGATKDTIDSDEAVGKALSSLVATSTAGGAAIDEGTAARGGTSGGGAPGSGGAKGVGSKASAMGDGDGATDGPRERRRLSYFLELQKRIGPLLASAFPKEDELELRSGTVIIDLTIAKLGNVVDVVVIRPSGFGDFDRNVVVTLRGVGALEPVPDLLGDGAITVRVPVQGGWRLH